MNQRFTSFGTVAPAIYGRARIPELSFVPEEKLQ